MRIKSSNIYIHLFYWLFILGFLTIVFGRSWNNGIAAFYFISMLFPVVLGTAYFFNYVLVPRYLLKKKYFWFGLYTLYTVIISLYLENIILLLAFIYFGNFNLNNLGPKASDTVLLAIALYFLVIVGSLILLFQRFKENQRMLEALLVEREKNKIDFLEIRANRKNYKIPYEDIIYVESLSDYIKIHTGEEAVISKMRISKLAEELPSGFLRIHRSFIVNINRIDAYSSSEIQMKDLTLNIGRSYKQKVLQALSE